MNNINKQETNVLVRQKIVNEGKDPETAEWEVDRDKAFIRTFNEKLKEAKKELKKVQEEKKRIDNRLKKDLEKQKKLFEKQRTKAQNDTTPLAKKRGNFATTRYLTRILTYLSTEVEATESQLRKDCIIPTPILKDGLLYLTKHNQVFKIRYGGGVKYSIMEENK